jgi:hypothetical protein
MSLAVLVIAAGCAQPRASPPRIALQNSWFTDAPGGTRGYQFIEVTSEDPGGGRRWLSAIVLHTHENRVTFMDSHGTLRVDDREVKLPEPEGHVYVLAPSFALHRVDLKAEDVKRQRTEGGIEKFLASDDWTRKLGPVLKAHEWPAK